MFGSKKDKDDKSKSSEPPKSPSVLKQKDGKDDSVHFDKWRQEQQKKTDKMAKLAIKEEEALPLAVRQLEFCPPPTRRHTQFLLSGYLAVKTSGGWTRKWQTRFCVLTPTFLYVYKRPPPVTEGTYVNGPEITSIQSSSVVDHSSLDKEKALLVDNDVITPQRLQKIMATADTTDDGSHELFGLIRDSMPIDSNTIIMQVSQLPNTFCLTFPDCPRLLLRAANHEQFKLWLYTIQSTIILRNHPPHTIQPNLARKSRDEVNEVESLVPHIEDLLPIFTDRSSIINNISYHHTNQSLYTDVSLLNKDPTATNVPMTTTTTPTTPGGTTTTTTATTTHPTTATPPTKDIVNSTTLNTQLVTASQVNLNITPSQGNIITNFTPWGQKVNIVLNQLTPQVPTTSATIQTTQSLEQSTKDHSITIQLGDGGFVTIPVETLYDLYIKHKERKAQQNDLFGNNSFTSNQPLLSPTSPTTNPTSPNDDATSIKKFSEQYADGLFTVSNSLYNADIHLGFRFTTLPGVRKDTHIGNKNKKLTPKQLALLRQQQDQALESLRNSNTQPIYAFSGLLALIISTYVAYTMSTTFPRDTTSEIATVWLTYFVLFIFTLKCANITFKSSYRRESLADNRDAITKMVSLSGYQQNQLSSATSAAGGSSGSSSESTVPILEIVPVRLVDRHTITGAVLLAGSKFDDELLPLPPRTTFIPQISLLKAISSTTTLSNGKSSLIQSVGDLSLLEDDNSHLSDSEDSDDDEVFETDPVLGKVYVEQWGKWCQSDYRGLQLRGPDYLTNKKKPKIPALPHRFQSCYTGIYQMSEAKSHTARWVNSYFRKQRQKAIELGKGDLWAPGTPLKYLVVNKLVPGSPNYNFIMYFRNPYIYPSPYPDDIARGHQQEFHPLSPNKVAVIYPSQLDGKADPLARLIEDFCTKDDAYRKSRFKYIPNVAEGAWFVKKTVGQTPVILGNKLTQYYYPDPNGQYLEVDVDVGSSSVAGSILGVVKGYAKTLAIDLNFLLEPHADDELPEALWGGCRIINVDLNNVETWEPTMGPLDD